MAMCAAVLVSMAACQKETDGNIVPGNNGEVWKMDYCATFEEQTPNVAKTYLGGDNKNLVYWDASDKIVLLGVEGTQEGRHKEILTVKSVTEENKRVALFELSESPQIGLEELACAVYPSDCVDYANTEISKSEEGSTGDLEGTIEGTVAVNFPATQTYAEDSFGNGANVAVGKEVKTFNQGKTSGSSSILFRNAFGVLELQLKGDFKVGKIKVTGHNGEKLNGRFNISLENIDDPANFKGAVATADRTEGDDVITLDCTANGGVQLNTETATTFYIVVPIGAFKNGFSVMVYSATGNHTFDVVATVKDNTVHRSKIKSMPEVVTRPAYQKADYVKSPLNNNPYIDTGYKPKSTDCTEGKMRWDDDVLPQNSFYGANPKIAFTSWYDSVNAIYRQRWNDVTININIGKSDIITVKQDGLNFYLNGVLKKTFGAANWTSSYNALLFARNDASGKAEEPVTSGRIYYFKIKNNGVSIRDYVPCYVVSGQVGKDEKGNVAAAGSIGMLDIVTGRLYVNRGSGNFTKGGDVSNGY